MTLMLTLPTRSTQESPVLYVNRETDFDFKLTYFDVEVVGIPRLYILF